MLNEKEKKLYKHSSICVYKTIHILQQNIQIKRYTLKALEWLPGQRREEVEQEKNMEIKGLNKQGRSPAQTNDHNVPPTNPLKLTQLCT